MKLYVGNLGDDGTVRSDDLRPLFEEFGVVSECEVIKNYAFVHMEDDDAATRAVNAINGSLLNNRQLKVEKSESKGPRKPSQKLFVGNIKEGTTNEELKEVFERFCEVIEADVIKNYGFVHIDADAGRNKINEILRELNGYNLNGSNLRVQLSTSGVRQKPGMGGDQCYRCGREGHWSKECPQFPDFQGGGMGGGMGGMGGGMGRGGPRGGPGGPGSGGPMRGGYGGRGMSGGGGGPYGSRGDPYPQPPPPSYMRERMNDYGGGGYDRGGPGQNVQPVRAMSNDPYGRGGGGGGHMSMGGVAGMNMGVSGGGAMYDRRGDAYGAPVQQAAYGSPRDMGGPAPMRDPYAQPRDAYANPAGNYGAASSAPVYDPYGAASRVAPAPAVGYSSGSMGGYGGAQQDMYSRRSPQPMSGGGYMPRGGGAMNMGGAMGVAMGGAGAGFGPPQAQGGGAGYGPRGGGGGYGMY